MIFSEIWQQVLDGSKTQTRRLRRGYYKEGRTYSVQPKRGCPAVGRILITGIWERPLACTTDIEVQAEGFNSREEFFRAFARVNHLPDDWPLLSELNVWVFEFETTSRNSGTAGREP